jgi:phage repressor protein C with HTH and peptisase S24 domain
VVAEGASARLKEERVRVGLNQIDFGKRVMVSKNTQMAYENGSSPITLDYLSRAAEAGVDTVYVLTGERKDEAGKPPVNAAKVTVLEDDDLVEIAEIDLQYGLGATYLNNAITAEKRRFSKEWLRNFTRAAPASLFWATGDGDSMEPTIRSGEVILIDGSQKTPRMGEGIWAVALGDFGMVKRIHYAGADRIELLSDNVSLQIPPIAVGEGELHVIGRVVAVVRRL